ncbi:MAG: alpha/beta hydrolase [Crocinitomicaceae bacterium]|nr:alpha/beta hydrolase [Crocinitomicaceae bacterium]
MSQKIFIFSGLGADHRVFHKMNFQEFEPVFIRWLEPMKDEVIQDYALRISKQITEQNPLVIGISFGGMMAIEVSKFLTFQKLVLIASAKTRYELPLLYRVLGTLKVPLFFPMRWLKKSNQLSYFVFGVTTQEDRKILDAIYNDTSPSYLRWALNAVCTWKNESVTQNLLHIHGTNDRILYYSKIKNAIPIPNGGHLLPLTETQKLEELILKFFK